jgi:carbonic anhydrase/acetyltransferase-like protein (isoleucine patch superfamily)
MALEIEFAGRRPVVDPGAFVAPTLVLVGDVTVAAGIPAQGKRELSGKAEQ